LREKADEMHLEKRILITGGAGFLGSHLCERLISDGAILVCVDNFFTGAGRIIEHLMDHKHFEVAGTMLLSALRPDAKSSAFQGSYCQACLNKMAFPQRRADRNRKCSWIKLLPTAGSIARSTSVRGGLSQTIDVSDYNFRITVKVNSSSPLPTFLLNVSLIVLRERADGQHRWVTSCTAKTLDGRNIFLRS
jgi:NAD-dependent epimerase/dehydratase family protein